MYKTYFCSVIEGSFEIWYIWSVYHNGKILSCKVGTFVEGAAQIAVAVALFFADGSCFSFSGVHALPQHTQLTLAALLILPAGLWSKSTQFPCVISFCALYARSVLIVRRPGTEMLSISLVQRKGRHWGSL